MRRRTDPSTAASAPPARRDPWLRRPATAVAAVLLLAAVLQILQVDDQSDLGNGDFYLRNATAYARGDVAHSRYSPGLGLLLAPLARLVGGDLRLLTLIAELAMVPVVVGALFLLQRLLRLYLSPWMAIAVTAAFALGQAAAISLSGVEAEATALLLVTGTLLARARARPWLAVVMSAVAVLVRVPLAPFLLVFWALSLPRRRWPAVAGLATVVIGAVAFLVSGPVVDQSYLGIGSAAYDSPDEGAGGALVRVGAGVFDRTMTYLRFGIPRLVLPYRALEHAVGPLLSVIVLVAIVVGLLLLVRERSREPGHEPSEVLLAAICGAVVLIAALLLWPVRAGTATRQILPVVAIPLLGLGRSIDLVLGASRWGRLRIAALAGAAMMAIVNVAAAAMVVRGDAGPRGSASFFAAHEEARTRAWPGPVVSQKPAFTELSTGRRAYSYPVGGYSEALDEFAERSRPCTFVLDELYEGMRPEFVEWVELRQERVVAARGGTRFVTIRAPWCPGPPAGP